MLKNIKTLNIIFQRLSVSVYKSKMSVMKRMLIFAMTALFAVSVMSGHALNTDKRTDKDEKTAKSGKVTLKKLEGSVVSQRAKNSFEADFGNVANVEWRRGTMFDEVTFTKEGKTLTAYYDIDAKMVGTTEVSSFESLPAKAQETLKSKYRDYKVAQVIFFNDNLTSDSEMYLYGTQFEDEDNYFAELTNASNKIVIRISLKGDVEYFTKM
jgi:hypothetical protein